MENIITQEDFNSSFQELLYLIRKEAFLKESSNLFFTQFYSKSYKL